MGSPTHYFRHKSCTGAGNGREGERGRGKGEGEGLPPPPKGQPGSASGIEAR